MKFKSKNGFYKFFNKEGLKCRIKTNNCKGDVILKFKYPSDEKWYMTIPDIKFKSDSDVITYICKNLETDGTVFEVTCIERNNTF